jgi:hypothetical protein
MQDNNAVWMWSGTFVESVDRSIGDPPSDAAALLDWDKDCERLTQWRQEMNEARTEYRQDHPAQLRDLYNFWKNIGLDDVQKQAMLARDTFPRLRLSRRPRSSAL